MEETIQIKEDLRRISNEIWRLLNINDIDINRIRTGSYFTHLYINKEREIGCFLHFDDSTQSYRLKLKNNDWNTFFDEPCTDYISIHCSFHDQENYKEKVNEIMNERNIKKLKL